jgi:transcription elongation factor Elf1
MELFRAEKIATVHHQSNYDCRFCGGKLTLVRTIVESESGVVIQMFECLQCGDHTWTA